MSILASITVFECLLAAGFLAVFSAGVFFRAAVLTAVFFATFLAAFLATSVVAFFMFTLSYFYQVGRRLRLKIAAIYLQKRDFHTTLIQEYNNCFHFPVTNP